MYFIWNGSSKSYASVLINKLCLTTWAYGNAVNQCNYCEPMYCTASTQVYSGYVDDIRNTDQSWMETVAVNFHDDTGLFILY